MIDVKLKFTNKALKKLDAETYKKISQKVLEDASKEALNYINEDSVGVAGDKTPKGGAPVWQGDPKMTTYYPGALKTSHHIDSRNKDNYYIWTWAFYAPYVINGHTVGWYRRNQKVLNKRRTGAKFIKPNPYNKRAVDKLIRKKVINKSFRKAVKEAGL